MAPLLELVHLSKRFGQVVVANDLNLVVEAGAAVGVVGPNGAGKTSIFGMISGDLVPDRGEVVLDGRAVTKLGSAARCRLGIGRTYQVPRPFSGMTTFENVLVAAQQGARLRGLESRRRALAVLATVGLEAQANQLSAGLGLLARKRLELARALVTGPRLLLLDEVAGGLTDPEVAELVGIVRAVIAEGIAVIWIEHVVRALMATVGRLVCLASAEVIADGPPEEVLASSVVREVYLGTGAHAAVLGIALGPAETEGMP